jgi:hypothetical protein
LVAQIVESDFSKSIQPCSETSLQSCTAWGPYFERKTRKMSPHGGRLERAFLKHKEDTLACPPRWAQMPLTATSWQRSLRI